MGVVLKAEGKKKWYRGVTHFHSLWSDGNAAPETAIAWYKANGYHFVALSDHNVFQEGERWVRVGEGEGSRLSVERLMALRQQFGPDWLVLREGPQGKEMRLKTFGELAERFSEPGRFLLVPATELSSNLDVHVNALNIAHTLAPAVDEPVTRILQRNLAIVEDHRREMNRPVLAHINHPNWAYTITAEELLPLGPGLIFEVYNGHCDVRNAGDPVLGIPSTDRLWDILLTVFLTHDPTAAHPLLAVATDDAHDWFYQGLGGVIPGRGSIRVLADKLTPEALIQAMRAGEFYASSGVEVSEIAWDDSSIQVAIKPEPGVTYTTQFLATEKGTDITSVPLVDGEGAARRVTHAYSDAIGKVLHETTANPAVYSFRGNELYVRAKVVSSNTMARPVGEGEKECAWMQPVCGCGKVRVENGGA